DYGFAWTPHGTYARDLMHFQDLLGFTAHESVIAATAGVAKLFMREHELGKILPGYYADCILVDGNPLENISVLQEHAKLDVILINGRVHKIGKKDGAGRGVSVPASASVEGESNGNWNGVGSGENGPDEFPEVKRSMQKQY
ncbi:hypothetical protein FQN49_007918, partial [Arthroderma sp. PD_2]